METKKIFVLGNGFDLAHYLPTAYIHFMEVMQVIENSEPNTTLSFDDLFKTRLDNKDWFFLRTKELYKTDELILSAEIIDELREKLKANGWFQHFKHHLSDVDTWIDFETEIESVLNNFVLIFETEFQSNCIVKNYTSDLELARKKVFEDNEVEFNKIFFNNFGLKSEVLYPLFVTFNIFRNGYAFKREGNFRSFIFEKIDENDYHNANYHYKFKFENILNTDLLRKFGNNYLGFYESKIFKILSVQLNEFSGIFSGYISNFINQFIPLKPFLPFGGISNKVEMVFTFNYSNTFQKFYASQQNKSDITKHLHGNAEKGNIVFGISDLDENLKKYKIFEFVKTYQKIINNTDFKFLDEKELKIKKSYDFTKQIRLSARGQTTQEYYNYEIIIWGHSLDVSDKEYIQELFALRDIDKEHTTSLKVYYHQTPHGSLANLMNIMGKDTIQKWVKNGWLKFEKSPDIYQIYQEHYKIETNNQ